MSAPPTGTPTIPQFEAIIRTLLSPDNAARQRSEAQCVHFRRQHPNIFVDFLFKLIAGSTGLDVRSMAVVLLRKSLNWPDVDSCYDKLNEGLQHLVKARLFDVMLNEKDPSVRRKLQYCVANFIGAMCTKNEPLDYITRVLQLARQISNPLLLEDGLNILQYLTTFLDERIGAFVNELKPILANSLKHPQKRIRIAALRTACSVVQSSLRNAQRREFKPVVPLMLQVLAVAMNTKDLETAVLCIQCFVQICIMDPAFYEGPNSASVISAMFQIAQSGVDFNLRQIALEFVATLCETSPTIVNRVPNFVDNMFPLCFKLIADVRFDINTFNGSYIDEHEEDMTNYDLGNELLDRMSKSLGGEKIAPAAFRLIPPLINDRENWTRRMVGLQAILQCNEGCMPWFKPELGRLVDMIRHLVRDPHPRVRFSAVHTMAQLSSDYATLPFIKVFHKIIFPEIVLPLLQDPSPRVQAHAATSVINVIDLARVDSVVPFVGPYMDALMGLLVTKCLKSPVAYVQAQAMAAITSLVRKTRAVFRKYYAQLAPLLKQILQMTHFETAAILRARTIECVGDLAIAVGPDLFGPDSGDFIELLRRTDVAPLSNTNPQIEHVRMAWPKIAKVVGPKFIPLLQNVIPPLLAMISQRSHVEITDLDEARQKDSLAHTPDMRFQSDDDGFQTVHLAIKGVGEKRIRIRTSIIEEKIFGMQTLYKYSKYLQDGFLPWVEKVSSIVVPMLPAHSLEEMREEVIKLLPALIDCVLISVRKGRSPPRLLKQLFDYIVQHALIALQRDEDSNILVYSLVYLCVKKVDRTCISNQHLAQYAAVMRNQVLASLVARGNLQKLKREERNLDRKRQYDEMMESVVEFLLVMQETAGEILRRHPFFVGLFMQKLVDIYMDLLNPQYKHPSDPKMGLCMFVDLLETGAPPAVQMFDRLWPAFVNYSGHSNPPVRQAAVYGLGAWAQFGGAKLGPSQCGRAVQVLLNNIRHPRATEVMNQACTANAVSALYKYIHYRSNLPTVDAPVLLSAWLNALPVRTDHLEAQVVHNRLIYLFQTKNPVIMQNVPKVLHIFELVVESTRTKKPLVTQSDLAAILQILQSAGGRPHSAPPGAAPPGAAPPGGPMS